MLHILLLLLAALLVGAVAYGVTWIITGRDRGLDPEEPDGRAVPLPATRPLTESDIETVRFDTTLRGYRMDQVDAALRRAAYDLGYKEELIEVLEAEIAAIRAGRTDEAEDLRLAREASQPTGRPSVAGPGATRGAGSGTSAWVVAEPDRKAGNNSASSGSDAAARATSGR
jgi:DivIVA domain-containing protein